MTTDSSETMIYTMYILREIGRLKGNLKRLWELSKQSPLDRDNCKDVLLEIRKSFRLLREYLRDNIDIISRSFALGKLEPTKYILFSVKRPEEWLKETLNWDSEISWAISLLESPEPKDENIKDVIVSLAENLEASINKFEHILDLKSGIIKISEFLSTFPQFTENWSIAVCYLTAMEIAVKNKLKELGLKPTGEFKKDYETLLANLKDKGIELSELEKQLPKIFWDIRNKVVHEGYSPSSEELEIITSYIEKILALLTSSK